MAKDVRVAVREALVAVLTAGLVSPYTTPPLVIVYRPTRQKLRLPAVTIFDTGQRADDVVPLDRRTLQIDIWTASDLDLAEEIAHQVNALLDHQPLTLPGGEGQVAVLYRQADQDLPQEDADLVRKMLTFTMYVYDYGAPQPFGIGGTVGDLP